MKKTIPFELFAPNQYIYFDIPRLAELETALDISINNIVKKQEAGVKFCIAGLSVGLKHHYHKAAPAFYVNKIETYLENGGTLDDIATPIVEAIVASGIFGKVTGEETEKNG